MSRSKLGTGDLIAIAGGGVVGSALRWLITRGPDANQSPDWFLYSDTTAITVAPADASPFALARSAQATGQAAGLPWDTLLSNLLGCLVLGALTLLLLRDPSMNRRSLLGATTGFCGSLTTFSTFAVELAVLIRGKPLLSARLRGVEGVQVLADPTPSTAIVYLVLSVAGGAIAFAGGRFITKRIVSPAAAVVPGTAS